VGKTTQERCGPMMTPKRMLNECRTNIHVAIERLRNLEIEDRIITKSLDNALEWITLIEKSLEMTEKQ